MNNPKNFICVICKEIIINQYGCNPYPIYHTGKCCNSCDNLVTRERLKLMFNDLPI